MNRIYAVSVGILLFFCPSLVKADPDTLTCMWLKDKYNNCIRSNGWRQNVWYDIFGSQVKENNEEDTKKLNRETESICNSLALTLKEERCP